MQEKFRISVHKFSSCDGCQLAFLNMGGVLLELGSKIEIAHFLEAGYQDENAKVDIAFIEGSVYSEHDVQRLMSIRERSALVVTIGACATSGGLQALRNTFDTERNWESTDYPEGITHVALDRVHPIADFVEVDFEIWGCPISSKNLLHFINNAMHGVKPAVTSECVCNECKRAGYNCVMVAQGIACMGPVTRAGCGALCPEYSRACYGCYGRIESGNVDAYLDYELLRQPAQVLLHNFMHIYSNQAQNIDAFQGLSKAEEQG